MTENVSTEDFASATHAAALKLDGSLESVGFDSGSADHRPTRRIAAYGQNHYALIDSPAPDDSGSYPALQSLGLPPLPSKPLPTMHVFHAPDLAGLLDAIDSGHSAAPAQPIAPTHPRVAFACEPAALPAKRRIAHKLVEQAQATPSAALLLSRARACVRESLDAAFPLMRARARVRGTLGGVAAAAAAKGIDLAKLSPLIHAFTQRSAGSVYFRHEAMEGEVAAVHASGASIYQGAGLALIQAVPSLVHDIGANDAGTHLAWLGDTDFRPSNRDLLVSTAFLSLAHANATRRIGFRPHAAFGLSIGEHSALVAHGVEVKDIRSIVAPDICTVHLGGESRAVESYFSRIGVTGSRWANYFVLASVEELLPILATETAVWITVRISPTQLMVSGEASACREVVKRFGPLRAFPLPLTLALHCPVVRECEDIWKSCCLTFARESRVTEGRSATGVRFYSNALNASYHVTHQSFAEAYTAQAVATVDFPTTILQAWEDGVRIFVEHGPRSVCTGAITETLGDLPHAAVSLDQFGRSSVTQFADAVAQLIVAGVPLDLAALEETT